MLRHLFFKSVLFGKQATELDAWDNVDELKKLLDQNPEHGDLIPGGSGMRKVRMRLSSKGRGSRGGARVIYYQVIRGKVLLFVYLYSKNEKSNLTKDDLDAIVKLRDKALPEVAQKLKDMQR